MIPLSQPSAIKSTFHRLARWWKSINACYTCGKRPQYIFGDCEQCAQTKLSGLGVLPPDRITPGIGPGKNSLEELRACPTCAELRVRTSEVRDRLIAEKHLTVSMSCLFGMIEEILKQK